MQFQPFSPVDIRFSDMPALEELFSQAADKRTLAFVSKDILIRLPKSAELKRFLDNKNCRLIRDINSNPSADDVLRVLNMLRHEKRYGLIIAIGGGSSIDLAKAVSALWGVADGQDASYEDIVRAISEKSYFKGSEQIDIIAVPTTAGTGSEVTRWATIWDFRNKHKLSVEHIGCCPKAALIIPELTMSMPIRLTLATGLDALSHAMEGFWAKKRNPLSQALALDSIERIKDALPAVLKNQSDAGARKEMCLGSLLAGLSFSMTKTTACHSISYPLTMDYGIEHGFAAALTLSPMIRVNFDAVPELYKITELFGGENGFDGWMADVTKGIQQMRLSAFGIQKDGIESIASGAFTLGRMDNNPKELESATVRKILMDIF